MANQIQATVYQIDGNPLASPIQVAFLTSDILIRDLTINPPLDEVSASITYYPNTSNQLQEQVFYVGEFLDDLVAAANVNGTSQIPATILDINGDPQTPGGIILSFPANSVSIWDTVDLNDNTITTLQFKNKKYTTAESIATLVAEANAGGGSSYKVYTAIYTQDSVLPGNPPNLVNVLENTITPGDTPVISYNTQGIYIITFSSNVLTVGKVFATCNTWGDDVASPVASSAWPQSDAQSVIIGNQFGYDAALYISVEIRVYN